MLNLTTSSTQMNESIPATLADKNRKKYSSCNPENPLNFLQNSRNVSPKIKTMFETGKIYFTGEKSFSRFGFNKNVFA